MGAVRLREMDWQGSELAFEGVEGEELVRRPVVRRVVVGNGGGAHFGLWGRVVRLWEMEGLR